MGKGVIEQLRMDTASVVMLEDSEDLLAFI